MPRLPEHLSPDGWMRQILEAKEARAGGVLKRQVKDVERLVGRTRFLREVERGGFQAVENGRHFVIFCNDRPIRRVRADPRAFEGP